MTSEIEHKKTGAERAKEYRRTHPNYDRHHVERQRRYVERVKLGLAGFGLAPKPPRIPRTKKVKAPKTHTKIASTKRIPDDIQALKRGVLAHYGNGKCACVKCGQTDIDCLSIDHINNDAHHRTSKHHVGGNNLYKKLMNKNYPAGYQTLCMSCNFKKSLEHLRNNGRDKPQNIVDHLPLFDFDFTQENSTPFLDITYFHKVRLMPPEQQNDSPFTTAQDDGQSRQVYDVERQSLRQPILS
jgi:hypothetical protein